MEHQQKVASAPSVVRQKANHYIHLLYTRKQYDECCRVIEQQLVESKGLSEYPIFVKALIKRQRGEIKQSLELFQAATCLNPQNVSNLKQVGRSLFLLGKHEAAIGVYDDALGLGIDDWEIWHNRGLCYKLLKDYDEAEDSFRNANAIQRHSATFLELADIYVAQKSYDEAIDVFTEALEFTPDNPELLFRVGITHLAAGNSFKAFECLGNALTHNPKLSEAILAAGSMLQEKDDVDVALIKYRVAAIQRPNSPELWSNIGMAFFSKRRFVAAIACLKRALYFGPCEWRVSFNLGVVHLHTGQYASAFHYFSVAINMNPNFAASYANLAIALTRLDDVENAFQAFERAIALDPKDHLARINYAIALANESETSRAREQWQEFERVFSELDDDVKQSDPDVMRMRKALQEKLT